MAIYDQIHIFQPTIFTKISKTPKYSKNPQNLGLMCEMHKREEGFEVHTTRLKLE